jgi:polysaccharide export outer membrane protein
MRIKTKSLIWILLSLPFCANAAYSLGPDDVIRISVYGYDDLKTETRVSADGRITFPLIGEVPVSGKSNMELEESIAVRLIEGGFIHDAQVSVTVLEHVSQQVSVLGYVNKPGRYPLDSNSSVVDLIAMAGGISELGGDKLLVTRLVEDKPQQMELKLPTVISQTQPLPSFKMQQGDTVYVPKAPMFYIYGEVKNPGEYPLRQDLSVVKALSIGGGLTLRGTENGIVVKRKDASGHLQEIDVEPNTPILQDDVIYIDERWF